MSFDGDFCPRGICDGSGWILDEDTDVARPCACREARINRISSRRMGSGIPRRFRGVSFDSNPIRDMDPLVVRDVRDFVRNIDRNLGMANKQLEKVYQGRGLNQLFTIETGQKSSMLGGMLGNLIVLPLLLLWTEK